MFCRELGGLRALGGEVEAMEGWEFVNMARVGEGWEGRLEACRRGVLVAVEELEAAVRGDLKPVGEGAGEGRGLMGGFGGFLRWSGILRGGVELRVGENLGGQFRDIVSATATMTRQTFPSLGFWEMCLLFRVPLRVQRPTMNGHNAHASLESVISRCDSGRDRMSRFEYQFRPCFTSRRPCQFVHSSSESYRPRRIPALAKCQRRPSCNHKQPTQRRDRTHEAKPRRIQREGVDAAAEHGHAGREKRCRDGMVARDKHHDGVDELHHEISKGSSSKRHQLHKPGSGQPCSSWQSSRGR